MEIGVHLSSFTNKDPSNFVDELNAVAKTADKGGMGLLSVMDHYFQIQHVGEVDEPMHEGYSVLNYLAGQTKDIKLSTVVTGVIYRNPAFLVKQVTTLDTLSKGRAFLGIGAAWNEREANGLGFTFPPLKQRFEMLEETLQIANQMWSDNNGPYQGKYYQLKETLCSPQPVQKPRPPILIGGAGERKTLKLVAKYADACNLFMGIGEEQLKHKIEVLKSHCSTVGRDFNEIMITTNGRITEDASNDAILKDLRMLADLGVSHAHFSIQNVYNLKTVNRLVDEIVPAVADW